MKFISAYKAERNIAQLLAEPDAHTPAAQKALANLQNSGAGAIPIMIDALASADKQQATGIVHALAELVNDRTFDEFAKGLCHPNETCATGACRALAASDNYNAEKLLQILEMEDMSTHLLFEALKSHLDELDTKRLLQIVYKVEPTLKKPIFNLIAAKATQDMIPDLIARTAGRDHVARVHIIAILAKFSAPEVQNTMEGLAQDTNRRVRVAAIEAMGKLKTPQNIKLITSLLLDDQLEVQSKAADLLIQLNDSDTCKYLVEVLRHDSEYTRRSAVEVLNAIADPNSVKYLLTILGDSDWWVRSRACDALGNIGGDNVISEVINLVGDKDENVRRSAIEILNHTKDKRAVKHLIKATEDEDWWVVERSIDALGGIGGTVALPRLLEMLTSGNEKTIPTVVRALGKIGEIEVVPNLLALMQSPEDSIVCEVVRALALLIDDSNITAIRSTVIEAKQHGNPNVVMAAAEAMEKIEIRFSTEVLVQNALAAKLAETSHTLLIDPNQAKKIAAEMVAGATGTIKTPPAAAGTDATPLDISTLQIGDMIEDRYKYLEKIGKGAFGTVLLVEDTMVEEQLVLKFLNPNVSSDEEMLKRFVHELRFSRKITHKNVIRIYDFLKLEGVYAISMEFFDSHTLGQEIPDKQPMDFDKAAAWAKDIANGMSVAHQVGIVHRDLKPANILIDDTGLLKVVDFGVASAAGAGDSELTKTGYVIGSPKYMAPEQILGKKVDNCADIYSLGVILYEMLTGVPPYTKGDQMAVMYQHVQGKCPLCTEANPNIPPQLGAVVKKAMELEKSNRYQSMDEFHAAIEQAMVS